MHSYSKTNPKQNTQTNENWSPRQQGGRPDPVSEELEALFSQLIVSPTTSSENMKKDFDKIHRALALRAKYLEKRKRTQVRKKFKREKFEPESIRDYFAKVLDIPSVVHQFFSRATSAVASVQDSAEIAQRSYTRLVQVLRSKTFKATALTMAGLTAAGWAVQRPTVMTIIIDVIKFILSTLNNFLVFSADLVLQSINEMFQQAQPHVPAQLLEGDNLLHPEASVDVLSFIPVISGAVSLVGTALVGAKVVATPTLLKSVKSFGEVGRATQGVKFLVENSITLVTWIFESVQALIFDYQGKSLVDSDPICKQCHITNTFMAEVEDLLDPLKFDEYMMSPTYRGRLGDARYRLLQFTGLKGKKANPVLRAHITSRITALTKILSENMQRFVGVGGEMRRVPFVIQFTGSPGCGKSTIMTPVANYLLSEEGSDRVFENRAVSTMTGVTKYWDGYRGESGLVIDDAFMTRGSTPGESEYTRFISLVSCVSMHIPKADLNSKGMTADAIRLVMLSSNCEQPSATEVNNPEAMLRRRHLVFQTHKNPGTDNRVDAYNNFSRYVRKNPITGDIMGSVLTFTEMLKLCSTNFKIHLADQDDLLNKSTVPKDILAVDALPPPMVPVVEDGWLFEVEDVEYPDGGYDEVDAERRAQLPTMQEITNRILDRQNRPHQVVKPMVPEAYVRKVDPDTIVMDRSDWIGTYSWSTQQAAPDVCVPLYQINPTLTTTKTMCVGYTRNVCCAPTELDIRYSEAPEHEIPFYYCNNQRLFTIPGDDSVTYFDLKNRDEDYYDLTYDERYILNEAQQFGLFLPPKCIYNQISHLPLSEEELAWEAIRIQERAFRNNNINQNNDCVVTAYDDLRGIQLMDPNHPGWYSSYLVHSAKIYQDAVERSEFLIAEGLNTEDEDEFEDWPFHPEGWFSPDFSEFQILDLVIDAFKVVAGVFIAYRLFSRLKKFLYSTQIIVPKLDYDANTLQHFLDSAPEAYRAQLLEAITEASIKINKEHNMAAEALLYDGAAGNHKALRMTPQGIVYDGTASAAKKMAMTVQAAFEKNGIKTRSAKDLVKAMHPEGVDENFTVKRNAVVRNLVTFHNEATGDHAVAVRGVALKDTDILVPQHFDRTFPLGSQIRMKHNNTFYNIRMENGMLYRGGDLAVSDWAILRLPNTVNSFRNIVHTIIRDKDIALLDSAASVTFQRGMQSESTFATIDIQRQAIEDNLSDEVFERYIARGLKYKMMTGRGDCGAPILLNSNSVEGIIAGIHVAGNNGTGLAQLVSRDMIDALFDTMDKVKYTKESIEHLEPFIATLDEKIVEAEKKIQNDENLPAWALVHNSFASVPASKSRIKKSLITKVMESEDQEFFTTKRATPTFSLNDPRVSEEVREQAIKPMSLAVNKYAEAPQTFPIKAATLAYITIATVLSTIRPRGVEKRLLTFAETLNGIPGFMIAIDVKTSMGFPYVKLSRGAKGKSALLKDSNDAYRTGKPANYEINDDKNGPRFNGQLLSDYFWERYNKVDAMIRKGIIPSYFAYENMKDELVSEKKIRNAKVRTFECLPLEISLLTRKYFGVFMGAMQQNCVDEPISVGVNPTSLDWTQLFQRLTKFGESSLIAGDYANWDGKLMADVIIKCIRLINQWYGDSQENQDARMALAISFIHTDILVLNAIIRKRSGMPSGVPVTAPLNSLCNWFYILAAIADMLEQQDFEAKTGEKMTPQFFIDNMEIAVYGDDHAIALASILRKFINFQSFVDYFKKIGITYTDSQKRDYVDFHFESIYDITYLKRRFLRDEQVPRLIRAPLDLNSITDMIYWTKVSPAVTDADVYRSRVKDFEDSLAQHEQATYDGYIEIYNKAIDVIQNAHPELVKNFPKIMTPYSTHTQNFLSERGVGV